jgi:hypothetical protein
VTTGAAISLRGAARDAKAIGLDSSYTGGFSCNCAALSGYATDTTGTTSTTSTGKSVSGCTTITTG